MKILKFNIALFLVLLLSVSLQATTKAEVSKVIEKTFTTSADGKVNIQNKFGKVDIHTWDKNEVVFVIEIKVKERSESKAQSKLDDIEINFSQSGKTVSAETTFDGNWNNNNGNNWGDNSEMEINYEVKMPITNDLDVLNKFGSTYIDQIKGQLIAESKYGNLKVDEIHSDDAEIKVKYGNGSIEKMQSGDVEIGYSNFEIESATDLDLEDKYSNVEIGTLNYLKTDSKYGSLYIKSADVVEGESKYMDFELKELNKSIQYNVRYMGEMDIEDINSNFELIEIDASYSNIDLDFHPDASFGLEAEASYGSIKVDKSLEQHLEYNDDDDHGRDEEVRGLVGNSNTTQSKVIIDVSYGNLNID